MQLMFMLGVMFIGYSHLMHISYAEILQTKILVDLGRIRFSQTSGNLAQLMLKLEQRVSYVERRSSDLVAHGGGFWRHLQEEILNEHWRSFEAARQQLGTAIAYHIAAKLARGAPPMSQEVKAQFCQQLTSAFQEQADSWRSKGYPDQAQFWHGIAGNIGVLSEEYHWFSADLPWYH